MKMGDSWSIRRFFIVLRPLVRDGKGSTPLNIQLVPIWFLKQIGKQADCSFTGYTFQGKWNEEFSLSNFWEYSCRTTRGSPLSDTNCYDIVSFCNDVAYQSSGVTYCSFYHYWGRSRSNSVIAVEEICFWSIWLTQEPQNSFLLVSGKRCN